jgi:cation diffusion facilitator CzcD-associated flavoprotein CzcO
MWRHDGRDRRKTETTNSEEEREMKAKMREEQAKGITCYEIDQGGYGNWDYKVRERKFASKTEKTLVGYDGRRIHGRVAPAGTTYESRRDFCCDWYLVRFFATAQDAIAIALREQQERVGELRKDIKEAEEALKILQEGEYYIDG